MMQKKRKLLFITRKFPPMVGGMESMSYALSKELPKYIDTTIISWGGSQRYLPFFLIYAFFKSCFIIPSKEITNIYLGDAVLSPVGFILKKIFNINCSVTVHGLDITYKLNVYQKTIPFFVSKLDKVICVSSATRDECVKRGIPLERCVVVPNGVYPEDFKIKKLLKKTNKKILLTVGRLIKRKGVYWFIKNVFPKISDKYDYYVVGKGPEKEEIENLITSLGLEKRVFLLGLVSDHKLKVLLNTSSVFVMPNIKIEGDIEGFGIVAIEASSVGLPVLASNVDGISDAVVNNKNGILVKSEKPSEFLSGIDKAIRLDRKKVKEFVKTNYSWGIVAKKYLQEF